jgi:hypothetical protein
MIDAHRVDNPTVVGEVRERLSRFQRMDGDAFATRNNFSVVHLLCFKLNLDFELYPY